MIIDQEFLKPYFSAQKKHKNYTNALDVAFHLQFHINGYYMKPWMTGKVVIDPQQKNPYFDRIIDMYRPNESIAVNQYRRMAYLPETTATCDKVLNSLKKIVKCRDWIIDFSKTEIPKFLPDEETLERYILEDFPIDNSISDWTYNTLIEWMIKDPNALCVVMPFSWDLEPGEFVKPYPFIIECKDVYEYKEGQIAVFLSSAQSTYKNDQGDDCTGKIIITVTRDAFYEARQTGGEEFEIITHKHGCGLMPAWLLGGKKKNTDPVQPYYESFVHSMLAPLDSAARDSSDLTSEKVLHMFSTMWHIRTQRCDACSGQGNVLANGKQTACQTCEGTGFTTPSPHRSYEINGDNPLLANANVPIPPAGYITKDTAMVDIMTAQIDRALYSALSAVNMEFLSKTPVVQSGIAKEVDRDELNNFVGGISKHVTNTIIRNIVWFVNEMRYSTLVPDKEVRRKMLPKIPAPVDFTFLSMTDAEDNLVKLTASEISPELKSLAEIEFLHVKYADQPEMRNRMTCIHMHNPLGALSNDELIANSTAGMIRKIDHVLALYINSFVAELLAENTDFMDLDFIKQREILYELAELKMEELAADDEQDDAKEQAIIDANTEQLNNPLENQEEAIEDKKPAGKQRAKERDPLTNS